MQMFTHEEIVRRVQVLASQDNASIKTGLDAACHTYKHAPDLLTYQPGKNGGELYRLSIKSAIVDPKQI